jgi:hypothetical protein
VIGRDVFTRERLAAANCYNFTAAASLSAILHAAFPAIRHTRELFETIPPTALVLRRVGAISLAVLGAAFEIKKLGGAEPLANWYKHHAQPALTFASLKAAQRAQERREAPPMYTRGRKARRRRGSRNHAPGHHPS